MRDQKIKKDKHLIKKIKKRQMCDQKIRKDKRVIKKIKKDKCVIKK